MQGCMDFKGASSAFRAKIESNYTIRLLSDCYKLFLNASNVQKKLFLIIIASSII